jgi:hypothetical protein
VVGGHQAGKREQREISKQERMRSVAHAQKIKATYAEYRITRLIAFKNTQVACFDATFFDAAMLALPLCTHFAHR